MKSSSYEKIFVVNVHLLNKKSQYVQKKCDNFAINQVIRKRHIRNR